MSSKRIRLIAVFGLVFVVAVVLISYISSGTMRSPVEIALPPAETGSDADDTPTPQAQLDFIEISPETVQHAIATLERPEEYFRKLTIESFFAGGSAVYNIDAAVSGGVTALVSSAGGVVKNIIVAEDSQYIWYPGKSGDVYTSALSGDGDSARIADEFQMIVTYEDILDLPTEDIIAAEYTEYGGERCIYIEYTGGRLGYRTLFYVSLDCGLLLGAERLDGDDIVYKMSASDFVAGAPLSSYFTLPDGTVIHP